MTYKEELWSLIILLLNNQCHIHKFCNRFSLIYNLEIDYSTLSPREDELFGDLCDIVDRFSDNEEDLAIPNVYFSESQIRTRAKEILEELGS